MGHFAKVVNGQVTQIIVATPEFFDTFVDTSPGEWIETSYNTRGGIYYRPDGITPSQDQTRALRKNYAGIGYIYDRERDAFMPPQPYASWLLNEDACLWDSPIPYPADGKVYIWNESTLSWQEIEQ
jgi:hypothetical protein